jgi:hypothetical protein
MKLVQMAQEFSEYTKGESHGCVTAVGGWVAQTRKPMRTEVISCLLETVMIVGGL